MLASGRQPGFDRLARLSQQALGGSGAFLCLVDGERAEVVGATGLAESWTAGSLPAQARATCRRVLESGAAHVSSPEEGGPEGADGIAFSSLGVPVTGEGSRLLGTLAVLGSPAQRWTAAQEELLHQLAASVRTEIALKAAEREAQEARELLAGQERRFLSLLESSTDLLTVVDDAGCLLYESPAAQHLLGSTAEQAGTPLSDHVHPEDREPLRMLLQAAPTAAAESSAPSVRFRRRAKDRSWRWLEGRAVRLPAESSLPGMALSCRDLTETLGADAELRESEARYRQIVETATEGVVICDAEDRITYVNPPLAQLLGYAPEEMLGRVFAEFLPPEERPLLRERLERREKGLAERYPTRLFRREGGEVRVLVSATPARAADGRHLGSLALLTDISEWQRAVDGLAYVTRHARCLLWHGEVEERDGALHWHADAADEEAAQRFMPISKTEGQTYFDAWYASRLEEDRLRTDEHGTREVRAGRSYSQEFRCRDREGRLYWLQEAVDIEPVGPGRWRAVGVLNDITQRKETEIALRDREARLREFFECGMLGFLYWTLEGGITHANNTFLEMLGYSQSELEAGQINWLGLTPPEHQHLDLRGLVEIQERGTCTPFEKEYFRKDGTRVPVFVGGSLVPGSEQGVAFVLDLSAQKQAERALQQSEARFRAVFDRAGVGVALVDLSGRCIQSNPALQELLGYSDSELAGMNVADFSFPEDMFLDLALFKELLAGEREHYQIEKRYVRKDGRLVWGRLNVSVVHEVSGAPSYVVGMVEDITARRRAEERGAVFQSLGQQLNEATSPEQAATIILAAADRLLGWDCCWLEILDLVRQTGTFLAAADVVNGVRVGLDVKDSEQPLGPLTKRILEEGPVLILREPAQTDPEASTGTVRIGDTNRPSASLLSVPIRSGSRVIAAMSIQSYRYHAYGPEDIETLEALANYCASALERTQAEAARTELQRELVRARELEAAGLREQARLATLREAVGRALAEGGDLSTALTEALRPLVKHLPVSVAGVWTTERGRHAPQLTASASAPARVMDAATLLRAMEPEVERLIRDRSPLLQNQLRLGPQHVQWARDARIAGFAGHPLLVDGDVVGVLVVLSRQPILPGMFEALGEVAERLSRYVDRTRAERALHEAQSRFAAFMDHTPALATMRDATGRFVYINRHFEEMYGTTLEQVHGKPIEAVFRPEVAAMVRANEEEMLRQDRPLEFTERIALPNGQTRDYLTIRFPVRDAEGHRYTGVISTDITERRGLEEQLRQAQKMEAIGRLAGGVAHDFNNMLAVINGYAELLLSYPDLPPTHAVPLQQMHSAGQRAASLTQQLLAFSRRQIIQPRLMDLRAVVTDVLVMVRRLIGEDVVLETNLPEGIGTVKADPGQMEQILLNLAVNARDAMPQGGRLSLSLQNCTFSKPPWQGTDAPPPGHYVCLTLSDTGVGIELEVLPHIFEPFFTTKGPGEGTGLGLATVYGIVQQSGGYIRVESTVGKGTTFTICLPRLDEPGSAPDEAPVHRMVGGDETILLVEDEPMLRRLLCDVLRTSGYVVLEAGDAEEALRQCQQYQGTIHLLLTDVVMPGRSGRELATFVEARYPRMSVLYMSGYTDDAVVRRGISSDQVHFIQKPFAPAALTQKVREVLNAAPRSTP